MDSLTELPCKCPLTTSPERHSTTFLHTNEDSVGCKAYRARPVISTPCLRFRSGKHHLSHLQPDDGCRVSLYILLLISLVLIPRRLVSLPLRASS